MGVKHTYVGKLRIKGKTHSKGSLVWMTELSNDLIVPVMAYYEIFFKIVI